MEAVRPPQILTRRSPHLSPSTYCTEMIPRSSILGKRPFQSPPPSPLHIGAHGQSSRKRSKIVKTVKTVKLASTTRARFRWHRKPRQVTSVAVQPVHAGVDQTAILDIRSNVDTVQEIALDAVLAPDGHPISLTQDLPHETENEAIQVLKQAGASDVPLMTKVYPIALHEELELSHAIINGDQAVHAEALATASTVPVPEDIKLVGIPVQANTSEPPMCEMCHVHIRRHEPSSAVWQLLTNILGLLIILISLIHFSRV